MIKNTRKAGGCNIQTHFRGASKTAFLETGKVGVLFVVVGPQDGRDLLLHDLSHVVAGGGGAEVAVLGGVVAGGERDGGDLLGEVGA